MNKLTRILLLAGVFLALTLVAIVVVIAMPAKPGLPAAVQSTLNAYRDYVLTSQGVALSVDEVRQASMPGRFTQDMSYISLGDTMYYQTTISYTQTSMNGSIPLDFPPQQVWCAVVERRPTGSSGSPERGVVFVAYHAEMYSFDWVVHQAAADIFSPRSFEVASTIGCKLNR